MTPKQLTMDKWRKLGFLVADTEKFNHFAKVRVDLFGFLDVVAVHQNETIGIQVTTMPHMNERIAKIRSHPNFPLWHRPPYRRTLVEGWAKRGPRGRRKTWESRQVWL